MSRFHLVCRAFRDASILLSIVLLGAVWVVAAPRQAAGEVANAVSNAASSRSDIPSGKTVSIPKRAPTPTPTPRADQTSFVEGLVFDARTKEPLAGATITLEGHDDLFETTTGVDGRYRFGNVVPTATADREYAWSASLRGYSTRSVYAYGHTDPQISVPKTGLKLDIALLRSGVVRGLVRDIAGRAVAGANVSVYGIDFDNSENTQTDSGGRFEIGDLSIPPRKNSQFYGVSVEDPRFSLAETHVAVKPKYQAGDEANVRLTMRPRAVISGRLIFRGKPLKDAYVSIERQGGSGLGEDPSVTVGSNGRYSVKVSAPARYKIAFHGENVVSQQATVDVTPGRGVALNREFKPFPYGSIRGRIVDLAGRGVKGADIELWTERTSETMPVATTDAQGRFFVAKVAPYDKYDVTVTLPRAEMRGSVRIEPVRVRSHRTTFISARVDTIPPKFQVLSAVPKVLKAGIVSFRLRASDNQGLRSTGLNVDGDSAVVDKQTASAEFEERRKKAPHRAEATVRWDARTVSNGMHKLDFVVWDLVGNATTRSFKVRVEGSPFKAKPARGYSPKAGDGAGY